MNVIDFFYLTDVLHVVTQALFIPAMIVIYGIIVYTVYSLGSVIAEWFFERRHLRAYVPGLIAQVATARYEELADIIEDSKLLRDQKDDLAELLAYMYLPKTAREEVATRLLANEELVHRKRTGRTNIVAVAGTLLGLMGTLICMGPGLDGLGSGDFGVLSDAVSIAFDTSVAGIVASVVCFVLTYVRSMWYEDADETTESLMNVMLEKADAAHAEGYEFPREVLVYDEKAKRAHRESLSSATSRAKVEAMAAAGEKDATVDALVTTLIDEDSEVSGHAGTAKAV